MANGCKVGWMTLAPVRPHAAVSVAVMPSNATDYAARLYAVLHELDDLGVEWIVVAAVPDEPEWTAIRDRLWRGAAG